MRVGSRGIWALVALVGLWLTASALRYMTLPDPTLLRQSLDRARLEIRNLEAVARKLDEFRSHVAQTESELQLSQCWFPATLGDPEFETNLRAALAKEGVTSAEIRSEGAPETYRGVPAQRVTVFTAGRPGVTRRALERVCRFVHTLGFEPAAGGERTNLRVFAWPVARQAASSSFHPCRRSDHSKLVFDPLSWLRASQLRETQTQLDIACRRLDQLEIIRKQVEDLHNKRRLLSERLRVLDAVHAVSVADFRVTALVRFGKSWIAEGPGRGWGTKPLEERPAKPRDSLQEQVEREVARDNPGRYAYRAGDPLADGVVKSIAKDHVIVEADVPVLGKPPVKRLLRFTPPHALSPITLSVDTTRITKPLLPDGTPDYGKWLNDKYGAGVTAASNAAGPLNAALAGLVDAGQTFFDRSPGGKASRWYSEPWGESDCPECADRLRKNEAPLAAVAEAVRRPRYFVPGPSGARISDTWIPSLLRYRLAANALAGRGMLRIGRGDSKGAAEDALTGQRLALLVGQGPQEIQQLIAIALRGIGAPLLPSIASAPSLAAEDARRLLRELQALPEMSSPALALDGYERFYALDQILLLRLVAAEVGPGGMRVVLEPNWFAEVGEELKLDPIVYLVPTSAFDWEEALRLVNRGIDLSVSALRATTRAETRRRRAEAEAESRDFGRETKAALETLKKSVRSEHTAPVDIASAAEALARTPEGRKQLAHLLVSRKDQLRSSIASNEAEACFRLDVTAVALAVERLEKGRYPEKLDALASDLLPGRFAPSAPIRGYGLSYRAAPAKAGPGAYALTAVPEEAKVTGNRGLCVDSTGAMRMTTDGTAPKIVGGVCDPRARILQ